MTDTDTLISTTVELQKALTDHYKTSRSSVLNYLEDHLDEMSEAEIKMVVAMLITGCQLDSEGFILYTGLHGNTVRRHVFSPHVLGAAEVISDAEKKHSKSVNSHCKVSTG